MTLAILFTPMEAKGQLPENGTPIFCNDGSESLRGNCVEVGRVLTETTAAGYLQRQKNILLDSFSEIERSVATLADSYGSFVFPAAEAIRFAEYFEETIQEEIEAIPMRVFARVDRDTAVQLIAAEIMDSIRPAIAAEVARQIAGPSPDEVEQ